MLQSTNSSSMASRTVGTDHGRPDRSPYSVSVVKRFILSGAFFLILNIWFLWQALKNGFFRASYNKVDYSPVSRDDSFRRGSARESYQRAIHTGYSRNMRRHRHQSCSSSKASTLETCDSGYSAHMKFDSWTDTSASEKCSDSSVQTSFWWKNESDKPQPLRSSTTAHIKLPYSDGTTSDTDDDVFFVPRTPRLPTKETIPASVGNCRTHAARGPVLSSEIIQPLMSTPRAHRRDSRDRPHEVFVAELHIHATSVNMGVERVESLFANPGPSPYCCVTVQQKDIICRSDGEIYDADMDWV